MRECISIHIGQSGIQVENACWGFTVSSMEFRMKMKTFMKMTMDRKRKLIHPSMSTSAANRPTVKLLPSHTQYQTMCILFFFLSIFIQWLYISHFTDDTTHFPNSYKSHTVVICLCNLMLEICNI